MLNIIAYILVGCFAYLIWLMVFLALEDTAFLKNILLLDNKDRRVFAASALSLFWPWSLPLFLCYTVIMLTRKLAIKLSS